MRKALALLVFAAACGDDVTIVVRPPEQPPVPMQEDEPAEEGAVDAAVRDAARSDGGREAAADAAAVAARVDAAVGGQRDASVVDASSADGGGPGPTVLYSASHSTPMSQFKNGGNAQARLTFQADRFAPTDLHPLGDCSAYVVGPFHPYGWSGTDTLEMSAYQRECFRQAADVALVEPSALHDGCDGPGLLDLPCECGLCVGFFLQPFQKTNRAPLCTARSVGHRRNDCMMTVDMGHRSLYV